METYQIIYNGILLAMDEQEAREKFAALFRLTPEKAKAILAKPKTVLRSNLDATSAEMYREKLTAAGLDVDIKSMSALPLVQPSRESKVTAHTAGILQGGMLAAGEEAKTSPPPSAWTVAPVAPHGESDPRNDLEAQAALEHTPHVQSGALLPFEFHGDGTEYFRIWIVNVFLSVLTLGIYSAWAKVRTLQYLYGNTTLGGASFQYLAKPVQLLKGRLIGVFLLALYVGSQQISVQAGLLALALLMLFSPALLVLGLSARLHFTAWRNVRFGFNRDFKKAYVIFAMPLLIFGAVIVLGLQSSQDASMAGVVGLAVLMGMLLIPYWIFALTRFMVSHAMYGNAPFQFGARPGQYYSLLYLKSPAVFLLAMMLAGGISSVMLGTEFMDLMRAFQQSQQDPAADVVWPSGMSTYLGGIAGALVLMVGYLLSISYLQAHQFNLRYENLRISKSVVSCELRAWPLLWLWLSNTLMIVVTAGLFIPWAKIRMVRYRLSCLALYVGSDLQHIVNTQQRADAIGQEVSDLFDIDVAI